MKHLPFLLLFTILSYATVNGQSTGRIYDFTNGTSSGWGSGSSLLNESFDNNTIKITSTGAGPSTESSYFLFNSNPLDLTANPYVSLKVKTSQAISLRVDLIDNQINVTNDAPVIREVKDLGEWTLLTFNFSGLFRQKTPSVKTVNSSNIIGINVYINPGSSAFNGFINLDDIAFGDQAERSVGNGIPGIKVDQLGFYPTGSKYAIASSTPKEEFMLVNELDQTVYSGQLGNLRFFSPAQDCVKIADFSDFQTPGRYKVVVEGIPSSASFEIKDKVHQEISKAALKYYYYNRLSIDLESEYAGKWARAAGHPDDVVYIHSSAATEARPENTVVSAPKGWYDAGDYNKYVVNSGITTYTLMALYERFWLIYDTLDLNIPESGNNIPDLLDEIKWNLDWMVEMQDPNDGGVYFKLTSKNFSGDVMPNQDNLTRYMVGKSTSSSLNYAATMAMAYRIYKPYNEQLRGFADTCLLRSYRAYEWAKNNPNIRFSNPSDVNTGGYGDSYFGDEFTWAAAELYISSNDDSFFSDINFNVSANVPGWQSTATLAFMSLSHNVDHLTSLANATTIRNKMSSAVSSMKSRYENTGYRMPMSASNGDFYWGSNAVAANQAMIFLQDYYNTGDEKSFEAAQANLEYLLGRNPLEYCFVTGFGSKSPMDPHHRPSVADGILEPVPGMLVGGPNDNSAGESGCDYQYSLAALEYTDQKCSYSTNEIAINWNAPLSFISGAIEARFAGVSPSYKYFTHGNPMSVSKYLENVALKVYPVPARERISFELSEEYQVENIELLDIMGNSLNVVIEGNSMNVVGIEDGTYIVRITSDKGVITQKVIIQK